MPSPIPPSALVPERDDIRFTSVINVTSTSTEDEALFGSHSDDLPGPGQVQENLPAPLQVEVEGPLTYEETVILETAEQLCSLKVR